MSSVEDQSDWMNKVFSMDFSDSNIRHDRILVVEGEKFYVLSELLCLSSDYFTTMFSGNFQDSKNDEIEIKDVGAEDFRNFLKLIYPIDLDITKDNYQSLIALSCRFFAHWALTACRKFILNNFAELDKIYLLEIAFKYNLKDIKEKLVEFIKSDEPTIDYFCSKHNDWFSSCQGCDNVELKVRNGTAINEYAFVVKNRERIFALEYEVQAFIFKALVDKAVM